MSETDLELLARFRRDEAGEAEDAFAELVRRHVDLVHSAALRQVRSPQLAEEVAQSAFTDLARNAGRLAPDTIVAAWLYQITRRTAIDVVRREARRQLREQIASEMNTLQPSAADWSQIEPLLDEAMAALDEPDRAAILLRYFQNKPLREVGATLGTSDDAAQKRVTRAVERLRQFFVRRGATVGTGGLSACLVANSVQAAPAGLAATISSTAVLAAMTLASTTATNVAVSTMNWVNAKTVTAVLASALVAGTGTYLVKQRETDRLRSEHQTSMALLTNAADERDAALSAASETKDELERLRKDRAELLRLRGEIGPVRRQLESLKAQALQQTAVAKIGAEQNQPVGVKSDLGRGLAVLEAKLEDLQLELVAREEKIRLLDAELSVPEEVRANPAVVIDPLRTDLTGYLPYFRAVRDRDTQVRLIEVMGAKIRIERNDIQATRLQTDGLK